MPERTPSPGGRGFNEGVKGFALRSWRTPELALEPIQGPAPSRAKGPQRLVKAPHPVITLSPHNPLMLYQAATFLTMRETLLF